MKISIYELLGLVKDGKAPKKIKYDGMIWKFEEDNLYYSDNVWLDDYCNISQILNEKAEILEEEKKIPEKLPYYSMEKIQKAKNKDEWQEERITLLEKRVNDLHIKMNEIIDYLKSKGE